MKKKHLLIFCVIALLFNGTISLAQETSIMLENTLGTVVTVAVYKTDVAKELLGFRGAGISEMAYQKVLDLSGANSSGSGFVIKNNGKLYVITNAHVIENASKEPGSIAVFSINRKKYEVSVVGGDTFYDIAVLEFTETPGQEILPVSFRNEDAKIGEEVYAIGNPLGEYPYSVSNGIISAKNRVRDGITGKFGFLQTTATVIWGNSGGPLIDKKGEVIGINSQIAFASMPNGDPLWQSQINFALEGGLSERLVNDIIKNNGRVVRAYLGLELSQTYNYVPNGESYSVQLVDDVPLISGVIPKSQAFYQLIDYVGYGLYKINEVDIRNVEEALGELEKVVPGQIIKLTIKKGSIEKIISLNAGELKTLELENIAKFVIENDQDMELAANGYQVHFKSQYTAKPNYDENEAYMKKKQNYQQQQKGIPSLNERSRGGDGYKLAYDILGAGFYNDNNEEVWLVKSLATLGGIFKITGLLGEIDFFVLEEGGSEHDLQSYKINLSKSDSKLKSTLWY